MIKAIAVGVALLLTLAAPFLLRPSREADSGGADQSLVVISPHNETIRSEFSRAFSEYMHAKTGANARIDWRVPGGTSEIEKFVHSSFVAAFENHWKNDLNRKWNDHQIGDAFNNRRIDPQGASPSAEARRAFLSSNVGIGHDIFFGGGEYLFVVQAAAGHIVDSGIFDRHPEWFGENGAIPSSFSGEHYYDSQKRWVGSCLSSFGIVYNSHNLELLGITEPPSRWSDLSDPRYFGEIALADPTKSGSASKAFEMLIQQQIHESFVTLTARNDSRKKFDPDALEDQAVRLGWLTGLNLIQRICANAQYFTDYSSKIPFDVTQGNAAAGMCIDYFGRTSNEFVRKPDGSSRVQFVVPSRGTSFSVDPVAMFRGAPHPELALDFIEFVLSPDGQKLWNYRNGTPGGPRTFALRRLPIRKDLYTRKHLELFSDPDVLPYENPGFEYVREWTGPAFGSLRFILKCMCLDSHRELKAAWQSIVKNNFPPEATNLFFDIGFVDYEKSITFINETLKSDYKIAEVALARKLTSQFRHNYENARKLASQGR